MMVDLTDEKIEALAAGELLECLAIPNCADEVIEDLAKRLVAARTLIQDLGYHHAAFPDYYI